MTEYDFLTKINGLLSIAKGVTYNRDTGLEIEKILRVKRLYDSNTWIGPLLYIVGPIIEGIPKVMNTSTGVNDVRKAYEVVRDLHKSIDQIKLHSTLKEDIYKHLINAAKMYNLTVYSFIIH